MRNNSETETKAEIQNFSGLDLSSFLPRGWSHSSNSFFELKPATLLLQLTALYMVEWLNFILCKREAICVLGRACSEFSSDITWISIDLVGRWSAGKWKIIYRCEAHQSPCSSSFISAAGKRLEATSATSSITCLSLRRNCLWWNFTEKWRREEFWQGIDYTSKYSTSVLVDVFTFKYCVTRDIP